MSEEVMEQDIDQDIETSPDSGESTVESGGDPQPQQQAAAQQQEQNYYAGFRTLPQFQGLDDQQIAMRLYETMQREQAQGRALQQYQQLIPVHSDYMANRDAFLKWKQAQQAPAPQAAEPPKPSWWNPPQIKDQYRQYLTRDAEGREVIAEHAPLEAKAQLGEWMNYRADFARKFLDDPAAALGPMVEQVASEKARELVEKQVTQERRMAFVRDIEAQNAEWLYSDQENKVASQEGVAVQKYIEDIKSLGVADPEACWNLSVAMLERDLALQVLNQYTQNQQAPQQQPPQQAYAPPAPAAEQAQKNMEFLRSQAARTAPRNSPATTEQRVPKKPTTFAEKLRAALSSPGLGELE